MAWICIAPNMWSNLSFFLFRSPRAFRVSRALPLWAIERARAGSNSSACEHSITRAVSTHTTHARQLTTALPCPHHCSARLKVAAMCSGLPYRRCM